MNEEIELYVREERSRGTGEESIRNTLLAKGWEYQLVDEVIEESRDGSIAKLFTRAFFRFAFGFITVISLAVGLILVVGSISQERAGGSLCIVNCSK